MKEIYTFSQNTLFLDVSDSSNPSFDTDGLPVVNVIDVLTNTVLFTGSAVPKLPGNYQFVVPFYLTVVEKQLRIDWLYSVSSHSITQSEFYNVVTPYVSMDSLRQVTTLGKSDGDLKFLEKTVRTVIDNYCAQSFGTKNKSIQLEVQQQRGYVLNLPERCWNVDTIYSQYDANTDLFATNVWKLIDPHTLMTNFHYQMGDIFYEDYLVTGPLPAPITFSDQHFFRAHSYWLTITGDFGWQTVPSDIVWAAKRLANTYSCNDDTYRVKQVQTVGSNTWTVGFNPGVYNSTGDLDVDKVLDNFYIPRIGVI